MSRESCTREHSDAVTGTPVILDHDGGVDDFIALVILASAQARPSCYTSPAVAPRIRLIGVTIVEADCFAKPCADVCRRVLALYKDVCPELCEIPVAVSPLRGATSPFPDDWRKDCICISDFPVLNTPTVNDTLKKRRDYGNENARNGHEVLGDLVVNYATKVTIVVTGPMTNVAAAFEKHGIKFSDNIERIIVMGGAARVGGNVFSKNTCERFHNVDGSAEWNIFWDAPAAKKVFECPNFAGKLVLFPLDATNHVPVTSSLVRRFGAEPLTMAGTPTTLAHFVGGAWSFYTFAERSGAGSFFAWDALTAAYLIDPAVVTKQAFLCVSVEARTGNPSEGKTVLHNEGRKNIYMMLDCDAKKFYQIAVDAATVI